MESGIEAAVRQKLAQICRSAGVTSLYAFGSRGQEALRGVLGGVSSGSRAQADLDLAAQTALEVSLTAVERVRLMASLEDFFDAPRVDLVILSEADAFLAAEAVRGELLYCEDEDRQAEEELYYLGRAGDLASFERARLQGVLRGELRR